MNTRSLTIPFLAFLLSLSQASCTISLVGEYDPATDAAVTELYQTVDAFLIHIGRSIGTDAASYEQNADFYPEALSRVNAIRFRSSLRPKNDITIQQLDLIKDNLDLLEQFHQMGFSDAEQLEPIQSAFEVSFKAIMKFELAKKR